ncbi:MAG: bifunctional riboflavin kinase/FAD synthetase [Myxococcales bacterium]|nr:bifunctional riboflavin kinase/FAD synthetase [Myxococcales bacterium]
MQILRNLTTTPPDARSSVVAIGNFDGVHLGHHQIFETVRSLAQTFRTRSVVVTFEPHPLKVLRPDKAPPLICTYEQKLELIAACGIDFAVILHFDLAFSQTPYREFVEHYLVDALAVKHVVMGYLARFGKDRQGDARALATIAPRYGFGVTEVGLFEADGRNVSSSAIRRALQDGDVRAARVMLGRCYSLGGTVVTGDGRGRQIGIPTANLRCDNELIPRLGVYAAWTTVGEIRTRAVINVGRRPTFDGLTITVEAHLLDFHGDLYGQRLEIAFVDRLRDEEKFDSVESLVSQIRRDIQRAQMVDWS